jgi:ubiquinone/menaquinone biosynthesis C-methylase UbiE
MSWSTTDSDALERVILGLKMKIVSQLGAQEGMTVVDVGCGQGGFTAALARMVGDSGRVVAVDVTDEYLIEFKERLGRCNVEDRVTFVQADAINLEGILSSRFADLVVGFRLLEELKNCRDMPKVVGEMIRVTRTGGKTCFIEMSTEAGNKAEEAYIRLHREGGDCFFSEGEIVDAMKGYGLVDIHVDEVDSDVWFSSDLAKQNLSHAQVWSDSDVARRLGSLIEAHGMKYPKFLVFSGRRP